MRVVIVLEYMGDKPDPDCHLRQTLRSLGRYHGWRALTGCYDVPAGLTTALLRARLAAALVSRPEGEGVPPC